LRAICALFLSLSLALPGGPAWALRPQESSETQVHSGLEEELRSPLKIRPLSVKQRPKKAAAPDEDEADTEEAEEKTGTPLESVALMAADYGFLPDGHPAVRFLEERLTEILPGLSPEDRPQVRVLASEGEGINAMVFPNGTIVVSPEMVRILRTSAQADFVLLHEVNHWVRKHFSAAERTARGQNLLRSLGQSRIHEYEADMAAFFQMAEEERHTHPLGAIDLLKRLREEDRKHPGSVSWDPAHGDVTDRILNMEFALRLVDLYPVSHNLGQNDIPSDAAPSLANLPPGGRVTRLLRNPPLEGREKEAWQRDVRTLLQPADWTLIQAILSPLHLKILELKESGKKRELLRGERERMEAYSYVLRWAVDRWTDIFQRRYRDQPAELREERRVFMLEGAGLPVFSAPGDPVVRAMGLEKLAQPFTRRLSDPALFSRLALCCENLPAPLGREALFRFVTAAAREAVGPQAAFGAEIRAEEYLHAGMSLLQAINRSSLAANGKDPTLEEAWSEVVAQGALALADVGQREDLKERYAQEVQEIASSGSGPAVSLSPARLRAVLEQARDSAPKAVAAVEGFFEQRWQMPQPVPVVLGKLNDLVPLLKAIPAGTLSDANPDHSRLLQEAARLINELPEWIPGEIVIKHIPRVRLDGRPQVGRQKIATEFLNRSLIRAEKVVDGAKEWVPIYGTIESIEAILTLVRWLQAVSSSNTAVKESLEDLLIGGKESSLSWGMDGLDRLAEAIAAGSEPILENDHFWQGEALGCLEQDLEAVQDPEIFFSRLERFLQKWPVPSPWEGEVSGDLELSETTSDTLRAFLQKGLSLLDMGDPDKPVPPLDAMTLERLLALSFFTLDPAVQKAVQEDLILRLIRQRPFPEAVDLVLHRYARQGMLGGMGVLEQLDDRAETPEDLDLLKSAGRQLLQKARDPLRQVGIGIATEATLRFLMRPDRKQEVLLALLGSGQDDARLRGLVEQSWVARFGLGLEDEIQEYLEYSRTVEKLKEHLRLQPVLPNGGITSPSAEEVVKMVYRLGPFERAVLLRSLLGGEGGVLTQASGRRALLEEFFSLYVQSDQGPEAAGLVKKALGALLLTAPQDELQLLLEHLFEPRLGNPPASPGDWEAAADRITRSILKKIIHTTKEGTFVQALEALLEDLGRLEWERLKESRKVPKWFSEVLDEWYSSTTQNSDDVKAIKELIREGQPLGPYYENLFPRLGEAIFRRRMGPEIRFHVHYGLLGLPPDAPHRITPDDLLFRVVPPEHLKRQADLFTPLGLSVETGRQLNAPGARTLQLAGLFMDLPESYRKEFLAVYDNLKGQSKVAAWETIKREQPEYARRIRRFVKRLGGGSLFTVYQVELDDGSQEALRVLNPNALHLARSSIKILREAQKALSAEDPRFAQAKPILDLVEEWIEAELGDKNFEEEDAQFRAAWEPKKGEGWRPNGTFHARITFSDTIPTGGNRYVRRQKLVKGQTFTALDSFPPEEAKELVALMVQHHLAQIQGAPFQMETLVHSNVTPGNFIRTEDKNLAVLDRDMYLKFNIADRLFLWNLQQAGTVQERIDRFLDWLMGLKENEAAARQLDRAQVKAEILEHMEQRKADPEEAALDVLAVVHAQGLHIPLKFSLLFMNLQALRQMARQAGFSSLAEAQKYKAAAGLEEVQARIGNFMRALTQEARDQTLVPIVISSGMEAAHPEFGAFRKVPGLPVLFAGGLEEDQVAAEVAIRWPEARAAVFVGMDLEAGRFVRMLAAVGIEQVRVVTPRNAGQLILAILAQAAGMKEAALAARKEAVRFLDDLTALAFQA